ncbi:MAG: hypothetical protein IJS54_04590 [Desulfovibrio sp.]|nr:hypothetical protein [Desulfovibrio sp.]
MHIEYAALNLFCTLTHFFAQAAATMPVVLCVLPWIAKKPTLAFFAPLQTPLEQILPYLTLCGAFFIPASLGKVLAELSLHGHDFVWPNLLDKALLSYTVTFLLWIGLFLGACLFKRSTAQKPSPLWALFALGFFASYCTFHYPFAGLPEGLTYQDAIPTIFLQAQHAYFYSFFPCGLVLLFVVRRLPHLVHTLHRRIVTNGCALIAIVGAIPTCLSSLGLLVGYRLRPAPLPLALYQEMLHTIWLICIILVLCALIARTKAQWLYKLLAILLLLRILAPSCLLLFH